MTAAFIKVDEDRVVETLQEAREKLKSAEGEVMLDFSAVRRIDSSGLLAVEDFASAAEEKSVKVTLRGVNVDVYKVFKLAKLTPRFSFVN